VRAACPKLELAARLSVQQKDDKEEEENL